MNTQITALIGGSGYLPIAVICCLIMLEELGVPMPFAPGDLLLVVAGVGIATGHLNPLLVVAATYVSALLGAIVGREVFERIGTATLPRIASLLHAGKRVEDLTARLQRGGAAAVFVGRITPGLRIVTTYVSGLVGMPRRTFIKGLAPGIAVYQAVFVGLGFWLGPAALKTIEQHAPKPGQLIVFAALVTVSMLVARAVAKRIRAAEPKRREIMEVQA
jgi:membrane protein DedA with SNARE-associated domain